jgi:hypothetical protein
VKSTWTAEVLNPNQVFISGLSFQEYYFSRKFFPQGAQDKDGVLNRRMVRSRLS